MGMSSEDLDDEPVSLGLAVLTDEDCPPLDKSAPGARLFDWDAERSREYRKIQEWRGYVDSVLAGQ